jgi:hypothetical protein
MTQIDCITAAKYWKEEGQDECDYLDVCGFPTKHKNEILIPTDEEGNDWHILTPKAARHVAKKLIKYADAIEGGNNGSNKKSS